MGNGYKVVELCNYLHAAAFEYRQQPASVEPCVPYAVYVEENCSAGDILYSDYLVGSNGLLLYVAHCEIADEKLVAELLEGVLPEIVGHKTELMAALVHDTCGYLSYNTLYAGNEID